VQQILYENLKKKLKMKKSVLHIPPGGSPRPPRSFCEKEEKSSAENLETECGCAAICTPQKIRAAAPKWLPAGGARIAARKD